MNESAFLQAIEHYRSIRHAFPKAAPPQRHPSSPSSSSSSSASFPHVIGTLLSLRQQGQSLRSALRMHEGLASAAELHQKDIIMTPHPLQDPLFGPTTSQTFGVHRNDAEGGHAFLLSLSPLGALALFDGVPRLMVGQHEADVNALLAAAHRLVQELRAKWKRMESLVLPPPTAAARSIPPSSAKNAAKRTTAAAAVPRTDTEENDKKKNGVEDGGGDDEYVAVGLVLLRIAGAVLDRAAALIDQLRREVSSSVENTHTQLEEEVARLGLVWDELEQAEPLACLSRQWVL